LSFGSTSYANWIGKGRRDWLIDVSTTANVTNGPISNLVNGKIGTGNDQGNFINSGATGREFKFTFPWQVRIDEFTWYQSQTASHGTWKIAGSNDDSVYTDLGTGINLGGANVVDIHAFTNPDGYRIYKLIQTAGTTNTSPWIEEIEFKCSLDSSFGTGDGITATSYANLDGTGDRHARMLVMLNSANACDAGGNMSGTVDGSIGIANCTNATAFSVRTGAEILIGFREPLVIDEFKWYQQNVNSHGVWKVAGSPDNITFTDLQTGIALGAAATAAFAIANTKGYNFYKLIQTSGALSSAPWIYEIEFKTARLAGIPTATNYLLTATAIATPAPVFGTAPVSQTHSLAASALTAPPPDLAAPDLSQIYPALAADLIAASPSLASPALIQSHAISADAMTAPSPDLGAPALVQAQALTATALTTPAPLLDSPALLTASTVLASPLTAPAPLLGSPALIQRHATGAANLSAPPPLLARPALTVVVPIELTAINLIVTRPVFSPAVLRQRHRLVATELRAAPWRYAFRSAMERRIIGDRDPAQIDGSGDFNRIEGSADFNRIEGSP